MLTHVPFYASMVARAATRGALRSSVNLLGQLVEWPDDGRWWLFLGRLIEREGNRDHATLLYQLGLNLLAPGWQFPDGI